jgi:hypothetical protein
MQRYLLATNACFRASQFHELEAAQPPVHRLRHCAYVEYSSGEPDWLFFPEAVNASLKQSMRQRCGQDSTIYQILIPDTTGLQSMA